MKGGAVVKVKVKAKSQQNKSENVNESSQQHEFLDYTADVSSEQAKDVVYETATPDDSYFSSAECAELEETSFDFNKKKKMESLEKEIVLLEDVYEKETKTKNAIPWRNYLVYLLIITSLSCCVTFSKYISEVKPSGVAHAADFSISVINKDETNFWNNYGGLDATAYVTANTMKSYEFDPTMEAQAYTITIQNNSHVPVQVYVEIKELSDAKIDDTSVNITSFSGISHRLQYAWYGGTTTDFTTVSRDGIDVGQTSIVYLDHSGNAIGCKKNLTLYVSPALSTVEEYLEIRVFIEQMDSVASGLLVNE